MLNEIIINKTCAVEDVSKQPNLTIRRITFNFGSKMKENAGRKTFIFFLFNYIKGRRATKKKKIQTTALKVVGHNVYLEVRGLFARDLANWTLPFVECVSEILESSDTNYMNQGFVRKLKTRDKLLW